MNNAEVVRQLKEFMASRQDLPDGRVLWRCLDWLARWRAGVIAALMIERDGAVIQSGPFKGMQYLRITTAGALVPRLLGCYESELHPYIEALAVDPPVRILDIGCAEGFYAVGFARLLPNTVVHAYDTDKRARQACRRLAEINGVQDRVEINELFRGEQFAAFAGPHTLVFVDIEGAEYELLDPAAFPALQRMKIIVETHNDARRDITSSLTERFSPTHDIIRLDQQLKNITLPAWFNRPGLSQLDQLLAVWEWRVQPTPWLVMTPR